jgi:hypothetical protein
MGTPDDEELEQVQEKIDEARDKALDDGIISDPGHEHRYYESGDEESKQDDDQTATPG